MIRITEDTLCIVMPHPCPEEGIQELQETIITTLQYQYANPPEIGTLTREENNANYMLLELLKATFAIKNT